MAFNSNQYAWKDLKIFIDGNLITGIHNIEYTSTTEHEVYYGRGSEPMGIQDGNESYEGSITLLQSEYNMLRDAVVKAGYKNVTKPYFTIAVSYGNTAPQTDVVKQLKFGEIPKGLAQNDKLMTLEMPFTALGVDENV